MRDCMRGYRIKGDMEHEDEGLSCWDETDRIIERGEKSEGRRNMPIMNQDYISLRTLPGFRG